MPNVAICGNLSGVPLALFKVTVIAGKYLWVVQTLTSNYFTNLQLFTVFLARFSCNVKNRADVIYQRTSTGNVEDIFRSFIIIYFYSLFLDCTNSTDI